MWNSAKTVLATMILIAASSTVYFSMYLKTYAPAPTPSEAEKTGLYPSPRLIEEGQEVSLTQAQALVPFKIGLPDSVGDVVEILFDGGMRRVIIVYAASKPSNEATIDDVLGENGIILLELPNEGTMQDSIQTIRDSIDTTKDGVGALEPVDINGYLGCAGGNVRHCLSWFTETTYYQLMANIDYPLQQLIKIAQSIPVK